MLKTVNVIEYTSGSILSVRSFTDTKKGNKEAEKLFSDIIVLLRSPICFASPDKINKQDLSNYIEDGYYEEGDYQLFLVHSS